MGQRSAGVMENFNANCGMASSNPLLKLLNITKRYDSPHGAEHLAVLSDVSLEVQPRESLAIMGPSGSGKSTLLQIMGTLDRPTSGEVLLEGRELNGLNDREIAAVRNSQLGFVFQAHYLLPQCTVLENVLVPTLARPNHEKSGKNANEASGKKPETVEARAGRLLNRVGLGERLHHRPGELSGGERQRAVLARALATEAGILLLDEPTANLDLAHQAAILALVRKRSDDRETSALVVTHDINLAAEFSDHILLMKDGKSIAFGEPDEVLTPDLLKELFAVRV